MSLELIGIAVAAIVIGLAIIMAIMTRMYHKASKEQAFVRTGAGGQKVVKDGGAVVFPMIHETIPINMQTLRLNVKRSGAEGSLITKDRLRADVDAEFYVRVSPDDASIATAAQTLGRRTLAPSELSQLVEGKFVDALRSAAATMDMADLHEKRNEFVQKVTSTVAEDLKKNGLELETVALAYLNQTDAKFFNPNNVFDAEGLAKLTRETQTRAKERNEIEADARVAIETKNLEANSKSLELKQAQEFATLEQERLVETRRAEQESQLATQRAERKREADMATIEAERQTEQARVAKSQAVKISETEAAKNQELAAQEQRIAVAKRSEEESRARADAETARAEAVKATEAVKTVEATAQAQRAQQIAVIAAETEAQKEATRITVMADAELAAADKQAQAKERLVEADAKRYEVESEGQRTLNEAGNVVSNASMAYALRKALIERMPEIIEKMTKPMEKVDSIRVVQMGGMGGQMAGVEEGQGNTGNLSTDLTNAMLRYRMQVPVVDELAKELGLDMSRGLNGMVEGLSGDMDEAQFDGTTGAPVSRPRTAVKPAKVVERPLPPTDKAEIQRLAGINPEA